MLRCLFQGEDWKRHFWFNRHCWAYLEYLRTWKRLELRELGLAMVDDRYKAVRAEVISAHSDGETEREIWSEPTAEEACQALARLSGISSTDAILFQKLNCSI